MRRVYRATADRAVMVEDQEAGASYPLPPRHDLFSASPDGFGWGYGGVAATLLAVSLAADLLGSDAAAVANAQPILWGFVALQAQGEPWEASSDRLMTLLSQEPADEP